MLETHPTMHARRRPNDAAYVEAPATGPERTVSWREFDDRCNQLAHLLRDLGLRRGSSVAYLLPDVGVAVELCWAAQRAGIYFVPISRSLTADEIAHVVQDCDAGALFVAGELVGLAGPALATMAERGRPCVHVGGRDDDLADALGGRPTSPIDDQSTGLDLFYSSGTTGVPHGTRRALPDRHPFQAPDDWRLVYLPLGYGPDSITMSIGPLYHASPMHMTLVTQTFGGSVILPGRFDAERTLALIDAHRVTHLNVVPTHLVRMLALPASIRDGYDLSSLRQVLHGAAPCPEHVKRAAISWLGPVVQEYYGGSEGLGFCTIDSADWLAHPGSVGRSLLSAAHIVDEHTWQTLPTGEVGVIYFEHPPALAREGAQSGDTRSGYSPQGWATLGDIGYLDNDDFLYLTDRKSNIIITGGVNVSPQAAENLLLSHPDVSDAAVVGMPDDDLGQKVTALVRLEDPRQASEEKAQELMAFCRAQTAAVASPRQVHFVTELPRGENGKLYKRRLLRHD